MTDQYQIPDREVVDYQIYQLDEQVPDRQDETPLRLRGPRPEDFSTGNYFVCIGAAQTFGRFCRTPYPDLLGQMLQLPVLNLGRGGAGFSFFSKNNENLLKYINHARFAVVQVMAARSESNALFKSKGLGYYYRVSDGAGIGLRCRLQGTSGAKGSGAFEKRHCPKPGELDQQLPCAVGPNHRPNGPVLVFQPRPRLQGKPVWGPGGALR